jgi:L-alanine-DL-glutamate epimerase-like enolase superfamily enzyme
MVEGHCRFDVSSALILARHLADLDVLWFEEPVHFNNLPGLIEVSQRSPVRIATGENFTTFHEFLALCQGSKNLILQPDIANLGGLKAAKQVCDLGDNLDIPVAPHDAQGPISKALCLQLCAMSKAVFIQEDFEEFNPEWTKTIASTIEKNNGNATIPRSPGLGRDLFWDKLESYPYNSNATLTLFDQGWERREGIKG